MRPASIRSFERLWALSIALMLAGAWITRQRVQAMLEANPQSAPVADWALPGLIGAATLASLLLWWLVGRQSLIGKWGVVLLAVASAGRGVVTITNLIGAEHPHPVSSLLALACSGVTVAAAAMLFRADARAWFGEDAAEQPGALDADLSA